MTSHLTIRLAMIILLLTGAVPAGSGQHDNNASEASLIDRVAATPPLGWNSYDAYHSRINEDEFKQVVDYMAEHLGPYGWEYAVIDFIWWNPFNSGYNEGGIVKLELNDDGSLKYRNDVTMDKYGRLLPAVERFPSSADGKGFKPLADYVHGKGLKFGIHLMRGIHRQAWYENTPVLGTDRTAKDIARVGDRARWNNNMFGVEQENDGAQAYYDSIFRLYAEWGVDYIKADDMMGKCGKPFGGYSAGEIEMMRKAIDNSGRPMVLSLSCGEAPLSRAFHLEENANMWRVSADFWDRWHDLQRSFQLLDRWSPFIGKHGWPDADMIPFGNLALNGKPNGPNRMSRFTAPEQYTLMTLFSIARSPLMIGGDLLTTPQETIDTFFKNKDVLYVNQHSRNNRQVIRVDDEFGKEGEPHYAVWIAEDPANGDYFVALFNMDEVKRDVTFELRMEDLSGEFNAQDLWSGQEAGKVEGTFTVELDPHGAGLYRLSRVPGSSRAWVPVKDW